MANVTRIKAKDSDKDGDQPEGGIVRATVKTKPTTKDKKASKLAKQRAKAKRHTDKPAKKHGKFFTVITTPLRPFFAIGRYIRDSWLEIRQVRWPNRKLTWKLTGAMLAYTAIFVVIIMLLDVLFTFVFNKLLG